MRMTLAMLLKKIELGNQKLQNLISNEANVATYLTTPDAEITVPDYNITECYNEHLELTTAIVAAKAIIAEHNADMNESQSFSGRTYGELLVMLPIYRERAKTYRNLACKHDGLMRSSYGSKTEIINLNYDPDRAAYYAKLYEDWVVEIQLAIDTHNFKVEVDVDDRIVNTLSK